MVAPKYGPTLPTAEIPTSPLGAAANAASPNDSNRNANSGEDVLERRGPSLEMILSGFVTMASEHRQEGNKLFKFQDFERAADSYSEAFFMLQKVRCAGVPRRCLCLGYRRLLQYSSETVGTYSSTGGDN